MNRLKTPMATMMLNPLGDPPVASSSEVEKQISDHSSSEEEEAPPATANAKRSKKVSEDRKKPPLWSEEDEICVLQGMVDFKADAGKSPYEDMDMFYKLTSKSISFDASRSQFVEKIRSLKKMYIKKVNLWGVEHFSKGHDKKRLKLAKYIWGSDGTVLESAVTPKVEVDRVVLVKCKKVEKDKQVLVNGEGSKSHGKAMEVEEVVVALESAVKSNVTPKKSDKKPVSVEEDREVLVNGDKVEEDKEILIQEGGGSKSLVMKASDWFGDSFLVGSIAGLGVNERFLKRKWSMVAVEIKKRMEEKWKLLQAKEMELVLHKTDFMHEIGSVIAEAPSEEALRYM